MENVERSRLTREAVLAAAQAILDRDGPSRLTLDAIAKESGISKGGLTHQFRSKEQIVKALLQHQVETSKHDFEQALAALDPAAGQKHLVAQIETIRLGLSTSTSMVSAVLAAMAEDPAILKAATASQQAHVSAIVEETDDADLAVLRWTAARGLLVTKMIGMCPFTDAERDRLFDRLSDNSFWRKDSSGKTRRRAQK